MPTQMCLHSIPSLLTSVWLLLAGTHSLCQDTDRQLIYPASIRQAEDAMANEDFDEALKQYRKLFDSARYVMARDAFNACQLAAIRTTADFDFYFLQCARAGVPERMLYGNLHIWPRVEKDTTAFRTLYTSGYKAYLNRIDTTLRREFAARYKREQSSKGMSNYAMVCEDNFNRIVQLAKAGRFPGENLIGPDDHLGWEYVLPTLLHYPYSYNYLKTYLLDALAQGLISPFQVGYLYGFNQTRTSILYTREIPVDYTNFKACYNLAFGKQSDDIPEVNAQRRLMYLPSVETERKIKAVASRYQIDFCEGY